jgi:hypothetical protein
MGIVALRNLGIWPGVARQIVERRGDHWCTLLARYVRRCDGIENVAAYAVEVERGFDGWPDWFEPTVERERAAAAKVFRADAPPSVPPPPLLPVAPPHSPEEIANNRERVRGILQQLKRGR